MSKQKREEQEGNDGVVTPLPKEGAINLSDRVKVEMNGTAPHHKDGEIALMAPAIAQKVVANGWGNILNAIALLFLLLSFSAVGQNTFYQAIATPGTGAKILSDTVTNTGTSYLTSYAQTRTQAQTTVIQVVVTKISGTVGGTISLQGSLDGTNFKALNTAETQTALATITAADASTNYHWRLNGCPFTYYRVSWTGTGTMAASFTARLIVK